MFYVLIFLLLIAIFMTLYRFLIGPSLSDRIVAFDVLSILSISLLVIIALTFKSSLYLDIALTFGLISFLGTTIFGRYIEKGI